MHFDIPATARALANELKDGKPDVFKDSTNYVRCATDEREFLQIMRKAQEDNASDLKANSSLPGLEVYTEIDGVKVDVTTPGAITGNLWRNSQRVANSSYHDCPSR